MSRFISLSLTAIYAIVVMGISSGVASAQQASWNPVISGEAASNYDGTIMKVRRRRGGGHRGGHRHRHRHGHGYGPALIGGLIIGGIIADQAYRGRYYDNYISTRNAHLDWCYNRYRSYRDRDNTFQPYNGPRRQCISPYYAW